MTRKIHKNNTKDRIAGSLYGMLVGDALAVPGHWYYSPTKLRQEYGDDGITGMVAPHPTHAESMIQGMSYEGSIDILHDKAIYYQGTKAPSKKGGDSSSSSLSSSSSNNNKKNLTQEEEIEARRDDHGNYVGATADERVHYHQSLSTAGMNTVNVCIARLLMRYLANTNQGQQQDYYNPDDFLEAFQAYMTTPPDDLNDVSQVKFHNDTYLDVYLRNFFTEAGKGTRLRNCSMSQRDQWSIGSLDGVVMSIPMIAAYANEPESMVLGRVVEHHMLTHRSVTVTMICSILVPLLLELYQGAHDDHGGSDEDGHHRNAEHLKVSLERAMSKMRPPKCTGRDMRDSYVNHKGPGNIPKHEKWLQHMETTDEDFLELCQSLLKDEETKDDEDVAGWGDRPNSRFSTACYCEQGFSIVLYLGYKYRNDPQKALLQNVMLGGHSTARGAVLGAILGAAHPNHDDIPFVQDLAAYSHVQTEIQNLVDTILYK